jgi:hypothetical protein
MSGFPLSEGTLTVRWLPGTDVLLGVCHCGARHESQDPVELWAWLLGHPAGHRPPGGAEAPGGRGGGARAEAAVR